MGKEEKGRGRIVTCRERKKQREEGGRERGES
jgi:hypothetical protein